MKAKRLLAVFAAFMMSAAVFAVGCGGDTDNGGGSGGEGPGGQGGEQTQQYTVTFNLNGAPGTAPSSVKVDEGGKVSPPDEPSWPDHTFNGWYTQATGGEKWDFNSEVTGNINLYAQWTENGGGQQGDTSVKLTGKIYLVGDSTVCSFNDKYYIPRYGYGTQLYNYVNCDPEQIVNLALSGRSSISYTYDTSKDSNNAYDKATGESYYEHLINNIGQGDYLIIGFGHNDEKAEVLRYTDPTLSSDSTSQMIGDYDAGRSVSFKAVLTKYYIDVAVQKGATPILCTPIVRLQTDANKAKYDTDHTTTTAQKTDATAKPAVTTTWNGGDYAQAIRDLGEELDLTVVDLTSITKADYKSKTYAENVKNHAATGAKWIDKEAGTKEPSGYDNTHTNLFGAKQNAYYVANAIKNSNLPLKNNIKTDITKPTYEENEAAIYNPEYTIPDAKSFNPATDASTHWTGIDGTTKDSSTQTDYKWYGTVFGSGISLSNFSITQGSDANGVTFTLSADATKGKIASSADMLVAVFIQVPFKTAFTVSADVKVNSYGGNQAGFGIMLRDDIVIDATDREIASNYVNAGVYSSSSKNNKNYLRNGGALTTSGKGVDIAADSSFTLAIARTSQSIAATMDNDTFNAVSDFDLAVSDSEYVYVCLWTTRGSSVTYSNIKFASSEWVDA